MNTEIICACAICRKWLYEGDDLRQNVVFEFTGDVDYIELAHATCAPDWE